MALVRLREAAHITLPQGIREAARLKDGDYLDAQVTESGTITLRPVGAEHSAPTAEQERDILAVVDEQRRAYAAERRR